jgi:ferredoxin
MADTTLSRPDLLRRVPSVTYRGRTVECEAGATLRDVLLEAGETPHNGRARALNCRGHGTCGTCAVSLRPVDGDADGGRNAGEDGEDRETADGARVVSEVDRRERARLSFPPHDPASGLRLSCRTRVYGDVRVEKHPGFWGQHVEREG